jgi:hypothetical protein
METISANIEFLKTIGQDGYFPVNFAKMLPYAGTPVEEELLKQGRLSGSQARPDYSFPDPRVRLFEYLIDRIFTHRNFRRDGLVAQLQQADISYRLALSFRLPQATDGYGSALRDLVRRSNQLALKTLGSLCEEISARGVDGVLGSEVALDLANCEWRGEADIDLQLKEIELGRALAEVRESAVGPASPPTAISLA